MSKIDKDKIIEGLESVKKVYPEIFGTSSSFVDDFNKMLEVIGHNPSEKMKEKLGKELMTYDDFQYQNVNEHILDMVD